MPDIQFGAADQRLLREAKNPEPPKPEPEFIPHRIGVTQFFLLEESQAAYATARKMSKLGHAVGWDTVYDSTGKFASSSVIHYRTCSCNDKAKL